MDAYQWAEFKYRQTFTHLLYNFIGAPQEAGWNPDVSAASQYGGQLAGLQYGSEPPRVKGSPIPHPPPPTPQPHHPQTFELGTLGQRTLQAEEWWTSLLTTRRFL